MASVLMASGMAFPSVGLRAGAPALRSGQAGMVRTGGAGSLQETASPRLESTAHHRGRYRPARLIACEAYETAQQKADFSEFCQVYGGIGQFRSYRNRPQRPLAQIKQGKGSNV